MQTPIDINLVNVEEYLQGEQISEIKHEYVCGQVFAMSGASRAHNLIALNIASRIRNHIRGSGCRTFISDMKVRLTTAQQNNDLFYYPDVVVTCTPEDDRKFFLTSPCLIFEVLSPSTETIDRREKRLNYQNLDSLQEYILVSQDKIQVEIYRREDRGRWLVKSLSQSDILELRSLDFKIAIADIYEDVF